MTKRLDLHGFQSQCAVVEFHRLSGEIDYMAKILARDIKHYDEIYKRIISIGAVLDVSSYFLMEKVKHAPAIPLDA